MDICIGYSVSHNPITYLYACAKTFERHLNHSWFQTIISLYHVECRNYKIGNNCQTKKRHRFNLCLIQLSVLLNLRQSKKVPPPTFEEKWKSHSLQQLIFKNYYQFLTYLFCNKIIRWNFEVAKRVHILNSTFWFVFAVTNWIRLWNKNPLSNFLPLF